MNKYLQYRNKQYFDERQDDQFLFYTFMPIMKIAKLEYYLGNWWLTYPGMHIKATTVPCVSLKDLNGVKVIHKEDKRITGKVAGGGWGLINTSYLYVFWDRIFDMKTPTAPALIDTYNITL